jgi:ADP-ribose pyrophosphatase YjhB (NUDIX family)
MNDKLQPNLEAIRLYDSTTELPQVAKVGILPFIPGTTPLDWRFMVMKPKGNKKVHDHAPPWQIGKGTRMKAGGDGKFIDIDKRQGYEFTEQDEPIQVTALREGREELGLRKEDVGQLYDLGVYKFTSATKKEPVLLHMFAAQIDPRYIKNFVRSDNTTKRTNWMTLVDIAASNDYHVDHMQIIRDMLEKLQAHKKRGAGRGCP